MKKIKLLISYDGSNYCGWQRQKECISIQEILENTCEKFFKQGVRVTGAGRTDAGVHALGQCATILVDTVIPLSRIPLALNRLLPADIVVTHAEEVAIDFHPQYWAKSKTYRYQILNAEFPIPQLRNYTYFVYTPLNVDKMNEGAKYFLGTHDFKGFCSIQNTKICTKRTIYDISVRKKGHIITLEICGNGFLHNMIRIMVGTLIDVGMGKIEAAGIQEIIRLKERQNAGITAPACGLTMCHIKY